MTLRLYYRSMPRTSTLATALDDSEADLNLALGLGSQKVRGV